MIRSQASPSRPRVERSAHPTPRKTRAGWRHVAGSLAGEQLAVFWDPPHQQATLPQSGLAHVVRGKCGRWPGPGAASGGGRADWRCHAPIAPTPSIRTRKLPPGNLGRSRPHGGLLAVHGEEEVKTGTVPARTGSPRHDTYPPHSPNGRPYRPRDRFRSTRMGFRPLQCAHLGQQYWETAPKFDSRTDKPTSITEFTVAGHGCSRGRSPWSWVTPHLRQTRSTAGTTDTGRFPFRRRRD